MAEPFIFINTYKIKRGKRRRTRQRTRKVADIVEAKEPNMFYLALHTSEDGSEATTVQVHADPENFGYRMSVVEVHIRAAHGFIDHWDFRSENLGAYLAWRGVASVGLSGR
jgi:hypothetical protein